MTATTAWELAEPDLQTALQAHERPLDARAARRGIPNVQVRLQPGDLYFFNTRLIHEVPGVAGVGPRVVLATFIGYSPDREDLYVWS
jgi:hypothetical protein